MKIPYYGSKNEKNLQTTMQILPGMPIKRFVDCCMGSGNVTRTLACEMDGIERIGIELDRGMFALHSQIRDDAHSLIKRIDTINNTEKDYIHYKSIVEEYLEGKTDYEQLEIATAELMILTFSFNAMRGTWRNIESYQKHKNEEKRKRALTTVNTLNNRFYEKNPIALLELNECWQKVMLINDSFMNHDHYWEEEGTFCYLDLPYELEKRGIKEQNRKKDAGYMKDMLQKDHESFISVVCRKAQEDRLKAFMMICTNYELDEITNALIIKTDDLYVNLLRYGFRLVVTERRETSEIIRNNSEVDKKKRRKKAEVVYINYTDIVGCWDNYEYYDYSDIYR